jgi:hypothetical protein
MRTATAVGLLRYASQSSSSSEVHALLSDLTGVLVVPILQTALV